MSLKELVSEQEKHFSHCTGVDEELLVFQSYYNPMVLFSRLHELGVDLRTAYDIAGLYERVVYTPALKRIVRRARQ